jgi:hypothetical protein
MSRYEPSPHARIIAPYMLAVGLIVRDVAELLRAHPRTIEALIAI